MSFSARKFFVGELLRPGSSRGRDTNHALGEAASGGACEGAGVQTARPSPFAGAWAFGDSGRRGVIRARVLRSRPRRTAGARRARQSIEDTDVTREAARRTAEDTRDGLPRTREPGITPTGCRVIPKAPSARRRRRASERASEGHDWTLLWDIFG